MMKLTYPTYLYVQIQKVCGRHTPVQTVCVCTGWLPVLTLLHKTVTSVSMLLRPMHYKSCHILTQNMHNEVVGLPVGPSTYILSSSPWVSLGVY